MVSLISLLCLPPLLLGTWVPNDMYIITYWLSLTVHGLYNHHGWEYIKLVHRLLRRVCFPVVWSWAHLMIWQRKCSGGEVE